MKKRFMRIRKNEYQEKVSPSRRRLMVASAIGYKRKRVCLPLLAKGTGSYHVMSSFACILDERRIFLK